MVEAGIKVAVYNQAHLDAIDSVWPDWFTMQRGDNIPDGVFSLFPMRYDSRRKERDVKIIEDIKKTCKHFIDLTPLEAKNEFLEGKGSVIYDHRNCKIYCNISQRATLPALNAYIEELNKISKKPWTAIHFSAKDKKGVPIYHTDCLFQLLNKHALVCLSSLTETDKAKVISELTSPEKNITPYELMDISFEEAETMCCNVLNVINDKNENVLLISKLAERNYSKDHKEILDAHYKIVANDVETLEFVGGGSTRCLLAEYF